MDRSNLRGYTRRPAPIREIVPPAAEVPRPEPASANVTAAPAGHQAAKKRRTRPTIAVSKHWKPLLIILAAVFFVWLGYGYIHTKNQLTKLSNPQVANESATQQTIDKVGKLVQLPGGETPTLATVNDASKLKSEVFFANAQNGDKVLIYSKAGQAVLYRPSTNKVIEFMPWNFSGSGNQ